MSTEPTDLPDDIDALRALILAERADRQSERAERQSESATAKLEVAQRDAELANRLIEIEHLKAMLARLRRGKYGSSLEKLDAEIRQLELWVDDAEIGLAAVEAKAASGAQAQQTPLEPSVKPPRKPAVRKPLPDHLPREIVVLEPVITCRCVDLACRTKIREDVTEVLEKVPGTLKVIRYVRPIHACRACERITQAPAPDLPILKGRPGPGLISYIAISKYCVGLPLYRLSKMFERVVDRGRDGFRHTALRTGLAVFPHPALQSVVSASRLSRDRPGCVECEQPVTCEECIGPSSMVREAKTDA